MNLNEMVLGSKMGLAVFSPGDFLRLIVLACGTWTIDETCYRTHTFAIHFNSVAVYGQYLVPLTCHLKTHQVNSQR